MKYYLDHPAVMRRYKLCTFEQFQAFCKAHKLGAWSQTINGKLIYYVLKEDLPAKPKTLDLFQETEAA